MRKADLIQNLFYPVMVGILLYGWSSHSEENREVIHALNKTNQTLALVLEQLRQLKHTTAHHSTEIREHGEQIIQNKTSIEFLKHDPD